MGVGVQSRVGRVVHEQYILGVGWLVSQTTLLRLGGVRGKVTRRAVESTPQRIVNNPTKEEA